MSRYYPEDHAYYDDTTSQPSSYGPQPIPLQTTSSAAGTSHSWTYSRVPQTQDPSLNSTLGAYEPGRHDDFPNPSVHPGVEPPPFRHQPSSAYFSSASSPSHPSQLNFTPHKVRPSEPLHSYPSSLHYDAVPSRLGQTLNLSTPYHYPQPATASTANYYPVQAIHDRRTRTEVASNVTDDAGRRSGSRDGYGLERSNSQEYSEFPSLLQSFPQPPEQPPFYRGGRSLPSNYPLQYPTSTSSTWQSSQGSAPLLHLPHEPLNLHQVPSHPLSSHQPTSYLPHHAPLSELSPTTTPEADYYYRHEPSRSPSVSSHSVSSQSSRSNSYGDPSLSSTVTPASAPHATTSASYSYSTQHLLPPPSPADDLNHATQLAATNRTIQNAHPLPVFQERSRRRTPQETTVRRKGSRLTGEHECECARCGVEIARFIFHGTADELNSEFCSRFLCPNCEPLRSDHLGPADETDEEGASYSDTLSAAVDRLHGLAIAEPDDRPRPLAVQTPSAQNRKRPASDGEVLICDVCTRAIATGAVTGVDPRDDAPFNIETICVQCSSTYLRCTDCGGGGGPRIGIGKWRSRELFPEGRKTCELSHLRLGLLSDMSYDVWITKDLAAEDIDDLTKVCSTLYMHNMFAGLAVPEMLEPVTAVASTFEQVRNLAMDSWAVIEPMLREDVESDRSIRRYLALRWSKPAQRKVKSKSDSKSPSTGNSSDEEPSSSSSGVVPKGKTLAGFVIAELDLVTGSLFLAVTTPWATGETYDATTYLMQHLLRRVENDIRWLNSGRGSVNLPFYPGVQNAWLLMSFKKDTRLMHHLQNRRGFVYLDEYLKIYPNTDRAQFAPYRKTYMPAEYMRGWHILVRRVVQGDDWNERRSTDRNQRK